MTELKGFIKNLTHDAQYVSKDYSEMVAGCTVTLVIPGVTELDYRKLSRAKIFKEQVGVDFSFSFSSQATAEPEPAPEPDPQANFLDLVGAAEAKQEEWAESMPEGTTVTVTEGGKSFTVKGRKINESQGLAECRGFAVGDKVVITAPGEFHNEKASIGRIWDENTFQLVDQDGVLLGAQFPWTALRNGTGRVLEAAESPVAVES